MRSRSYRAFATALGLAIAGLTTHRIGAAQDAQASRCLPQESRLTSPAEVQIHCFPNRGSTVPPSSVALFLPKSGETNPSPIETTTLITPVERGIPSEGLWLSVRFSGPLESNRRYRLRLNFPSGSPIESPLDTTPLAKCTVGDDYKILSATQIIVRCGESGIGFLPAPSIDFASVDTKSGAITKIPNAVTSVRYVPDSQWWLVTLAEGAKLVPKQKYQLVLRFPTPSVVAIDKE